MPITNLHKKKKIKNIVVAALVMLLFFIIFTVTIQKLTPKNNLPSKNTSSMNG